MKPFSTSKVSKDEFSDAELQEDEAPDEASRESRVDSSITHNILTLARKSLAEAPMHKPMRSLSQTISHQRKPQIAPIFTIDEENYTDPKKRRVSSKQLPKKQDRKEDERKQEEKRGFKLRF